MIVSFLLPKHRSLLLATVVASSSTSQLQLVVVPVIIMMTSTIDQTTTRRTLSSSSSSSSSTGHSFPLLMLKLIFGSPAQHFLPANAHVIINNKNIVIAENMQQLKPASNTDKLLRCLPTTVLDYQHLYIRFNSNSFPFYGPYVIFIQASSKVAFPMNLYS